MQVIAEGVENEEELAFLHMLDCDEIQGFFFRGCYLFEGAGNAAIQDSRITMYFIASQIADPVCLKDMRRTGLNPPSIYGPTIR